MARKPTADARKALLCGADPSVEKAAARVVQSDTLRAVSEECLAMQSKTLAPVTVDKARWMLDTFILSRLGDKLIADLKAPEFSPRCAGSKRRAGTKRQPAQSNASGRSCATPSPPAAPSGTSPPTCAVRWHRSRRKTALP
jgi:hypothetical protein